jgi:hypothetical protein
MSAMGRLEPVDRGAPNARLRRNLAVAGPCGEGPFTIPFADLHHLCGANRWVNDLRPGNPPEELAPLRLVRQERKGLTPRVQRTRLPCGYWERSEQHLAQGLTKHI